MKIAFHSNQLGIRGTEVALYDYALGNRDILGNESIIISDANSDLTTLKKFKSQFPVYLYNKFEEVENILQQENVDSIYYIKAGFNDGKLVKNAKNIVHCVFEYNDPHGEVYSYVSKWLSKSASQGRFPYVPHMINLPVHNHNYRDFLNIQDKFVVGWYGGNNFEIQFAQQAVVEAAKLRPDIVFLFMNQDPFCDLTNVLFIQSTTDLQEKVAFINTCDVMIHARERGETFGLTVGEFSTLNRPIITYKESPEKNHIEILGDKGLYYSNYRELLDLLTNISQKDIQGKDWNCYRDFTPEKVMDTFNQVFLK